MRYALGVEYDGGGFNGWQAQRDDPSVQVCLQDALANVADHAVTVICAGRTDTGVHAACQVVHFDTQSRRTPRQWILGINRRLPATVSVRWVQEVSEDFHARFCAIERQYRYTILNRWVHPAIRAGKVSWCRYPLDVEKMNKAVAALHGEHDFSAFRSAGCKARHAVREVTHAGVTRRDDEVIFDISANGFLYHMVRNIAGSLIEVGSGNRKPDWIGALLKGRDRMLAGITATAAGLYFIGPRYPDKYALPVYPFDPFPRGQDQS